MGMQGEQRKRQLGVIYPKFPMRSKRALSDEDESAAFGTLDIEAQGPSTRNRTTGSFAKQYKRSPVLPLEPPARRL